MTRSWAQLLGDAAATEESAEERRGVFGRLRDSLGKSRRALTEQLQVAAFDPQDDASWERLEEALIYADVGVRATAELIRRLEARQELGDLTTALAEEVSTLFGEAPTLDVRHEPAVILVVGVNGTGKTTTIGKLASRLRESGREVTVAAADTFRAAAEEQLEIWAQRAGARFVGAVGVTGVALTKLDGSAKGGIAVAIAYELGLPVKLVGVGEALDDLRPFDAQDFAHALVAG